MARMVLLQHDLPHGSWHYDWLIERLAGAATLLTYRLQTRPDEGGVAALEAERLPDHRSAYLAYEGEVAGGRGRVRRLAVGEAVVEQEDARTLSFSCRFEGGPTMRCEGRPHKEKGEARSFWIFHLAPAPSGGILNADAADRCQCPARPRGR